MVYENLLAVLFLPIIEHLFSLQYIRHLAALQFLPSQNIFTARPTQIPAPVNPIPLASSSTLCSIRTLASPSRQSASFILVSQPDSIQIVLIMKRSSSATPELPVPILPRTSNAARPGSKKCEMCGRGHDATFGAGRFCSSKCARTVGGLAHRRKRALERAAQRPPSAFLPPPAAGSSSGLPKPAAKGKGKGGRRMSTFAQPSGKTGSTTRIAIPSLLNPEKK